MKKFYCLFLVLVAFILLPIQHGYAEKTRWKDPAFNFERIKEVRLVSLEFMDSDSDTFTTDAAAELKVETALRQAADKSGIKLIIDLEPKYLDEENTAKPAETTPPAEESVLRPSASIPKLKMKVHSLGKQWSWREAWTEVRYVTKKTRIYNSDGTSSTIETPEKEEIYHPREKIWSAYVEIEFILTGPNSDKVILSLFDSRGIKYTTDTSGMLKRICQEAMKDMSKNN